MTLVATIPALNIPPFAKQLHFAAFAVAFRDNPVDCELGKIDAKASLLCTASASIAALFAALLDETNIFPDDLSVLRVQCRTRI
jgi:hypothetical protein